MAYNKFRKGTTPQHGPATHPVVVNDLSDNCGLASVGSRSEEDNCKIECHGKSRLQISPGRNVRQCTSSNLDKSLEV